MNVKDYFINLWNKLFLKDIEEQEDEVVEVPPEEPIINDVKIVNHAHRFSKKTTQEKARLKHHKLTDVEVEK